jgi:hypothetical protein
MKEVLVAVSRQNEPKAAAGRQVHWFSLDDPEPLRDALDSIPASREHAARLSFLVAQLLR